MASVMAPDSAGGHHRALRSCSRLRNVFTRLFLQVSAERTGWSAAFCHRAPAPRAACTHAVRVGVGAGCIDDGRNAQLLVVVFAGNFAFRESEGPCG